MKINGVSYNTKYKVLDGIKYYEVIVFNMPSDMKKMLTSSINNDKLVSIEYHDEDGSYTGDVHISYFGSNKFYIKKD